MIDQIVNYWQLQDKVKEAIEEDKKVMENQGKKFDDNHHETMKEEWFKEEDNEEQHPERDNHEAF